MASGTTGEFYCGTYIRGRIRWETTKVNGGHNVTLRMDVYRNNNYNGVPIANNQQTDWLYIDGQYSTWKNTTVSNEKTWHQLFETTKFVSHIAEKKIVCGWKTDDPYSYWMGSWFGLEIMLEAIGSAPKIESASQSGSSYSNGDIDAGVTYAFSCKVQNWGVGQGPNTITFALFPFGTTSWRGPRNEKTFTITDGRTSIEERFIVFPGSGDMEKVEGGFELTPGGRFAVAAKIDNGYATDILFSDKDGYYFIPGSPTIQIISDVPNSDGTTKLKLMVVEDERLAKDTLYTMYLEVTPTGGSKQTLTSPQHHPSGPVYFEVDVPQNNAIKLEAYDRVNYRSGYYIKGASVILRDYISKMSTPTISAKWDTLRKSLQPTIKYSLNATRVELITTLPNGQVRTDTVPMGTSPEGTTVGLSYLIDLPHGSGQEVRMVARAYYSDGKTEESPTYIFPIPNPILGVAAFTDKDKKYIVDIVEHKDNDTVTPLWGVGTRIVKK